MFKKIIPLLIILMLAAVLRFIWLDRIPNSVNGDELYYLLNSRAFSLTGKDLSQTLSPSKILFFYYPPHNIVQAELPFFLQMATSGIFGLSLFNSFISDALFGIGVVLLIYLITKKLLNNTIALFAGFFAAINPWFIFTSRSAYEMMPATFFYLCAFYVLLKAKKWKILFALPLFILAFYSYIGTKILLLPVALAFALFSYFIFHKKQFAKNYFILMFLLTLFVGFFLFRLHQDPGSSRLSEINTPFSPAIAKEVNNLRLGTISTPLMNIFESKFTVYIMTIATNISYVFSPEYLFLHGDYFTSLGKYGLFYPLDCVFLIIGSVWLFKNKRSLFIFLYTTIGLSILPEILHHTGGAGNFTPHISLLFPFFIIILAAGAWGVFYFLKSKKNYFVIVSLFIIYFFSIGFFLNIYFFQMPLQTGFFNFADRIFASYLNLARQDQKNINIYTQDARGKFQEYLFYNNLYTRENATAIASSLNNANYTLDGVSFLPCDKKKIDKDKNSLLLIHSQCETSINAPYLLVPQVYDSGGVYRIYNDTTCSGYPLNTYVSGLTINDLALDKLSKESFCFKFIIKS